MAFVPLGIDPHQPDLAPVDPVLIDEVVEPHSVGSDG